MKRITFTSRSLSLNVFLLIAVFILVPVYVSMIILKSSYESYIRRELNSQIISTIQKGETEFADTFQKMAIISNIFALDSEMLRLLADSNSSYWDRNKRFDQLTNTITINNLFNLDGIKITMFDREKRNYANWGLYFNDYSYLLDQDWVAESIGLKGHIAWNLFAPSFIIGENEKYISMARSILYPAYTGERIATIIISINEKYINSLLMRNNDSADFIRVCTADTVEDVFTVNRINYSGDLKTILEQAQKSGANSIVRGAGGKSYLLAYYPINSPWMPVRKGLTVLYFSDYGQINKKLNSLSVSINIGMASIVIILLLIVVFISRNIAKPIRLLSGMVNEFTKTRKIKPYTPGRSDEIGELGRAFNEMEIRINDLFDELRRESEIREQYRFRALRAQINPHFLFNTLNTIRWMAMIRQQENIADTIDALSRILDYSMGRSGEIAAVSEELEMIYSYVHIQNYRYGEDLEVTVDMEDSVRGLGIIRFILQPAVENSFIHAFKKIRGKKHLFIKGRIQDNKLMLMVKDNGCGMSQKELEKIRRRLEEKNPAAEITTKNSLDNSSDASADISERSGIGLFSVQQRICSAYGQEYGINVSIMDGTAVTYTLPFIKLEPEAGTGDNNEETAGS
ncbi:MAG: histidine kinase [Treponema sp.]|nr:histidine kinase [Treponema sp.]